MPQLFKKLNSLDWLFSRFDLSDHRNEGNIEDDWEYIEFLDHELGEDEFGDVELSDQGDIGSVYSFSHAHKSKIKYTILSKANLRQRLEDSITKVYEVLLLTRNEAAILLQHFKWAVNETIVEWLASEVKIRQAVGLFVSPVVETLADATEVTCTICHAHLSKDYTYSASCGHQICRFCWEEYISEAINNGPQCLALRCPETSCNAAVGPYLMEQLASEEDKKKFEDHLLRSYLLGSKKKVKWCPALNCGCAVLSSVDIEKVTCQCFQTFCWKCSLEGHAPVDCATAKVWMTEGDRRSEDWVNANTTKCPNCNYRYEKRETQFFDFAQCVVCDQSFCSVCGDKCDITQYMAHSCIVNAESEYKAILKKSVERYNRYYEAWATCESSMVNALTDLKHIKEFQQNVHPDLFGEVGFVVEAIQQVIKCWQFLKWTYVYGYLVLPDDQTAKKNFLEFTQEDATGLVKQLQKCLDIYQDCLYEYIQPLDLLQFRKKLIQLTSVIRRYFASLEEGLLDELSKMFSDSQKSGVASPSNKIMRREGDINLNGSVGSLKFEDSPKSDLEVPLVHRIKDEE